MDNINVRFMEKAPAGFHGMTVQNPDGSYTVLLDPNDSQERRLKAYKHEIRHILGEDLKKGNVQKIEEDARR